MARYTDDTINRIKQDVSLERLVVSQGYNLKKHGKDYSLSCPFHEDKTASLVITPSKNLFNCFGCGASGSVIDWVMKTQSVSFRHAVEILSGDIPSLAAEVKEPKRSAVPKLESPLSDCKDHQAVLHDVITYYHNTLKQSPEALDYLESRGLKCDDLINTFKLGYANRTLGYHLPAKNRKAGAEQRGQLQAIGLLRESGHEHFNGSIVVPVFNDQQQITEVYGRKILGARLRKGTAQHLYLPDAHAGVWNEQALAVSSEIILCEALIDAMTFWVHGFRNVTSSYGTSGFTPDHLAAFKKHGVKRVLIAYDRDEAGSSAAIKLAEKLIAEGIDCFRINLPKGMDVNDYAMKVTPAQKSLGLVIRKAEWMGQGERPSRDERCSARPERLAKDGEAGTKHQGRFSGTESVETDISLLLAAKEKKVEPVIPESTVEESIIAEPCTANPIPEASECELNAEVTEQDKSVGNRFAQPQAALQGVVQDESHELKFTIGQRFYRVRGLQKNMSYEQLKINLLVSQDEAVHVDQLELYNAKARQSFIRQASIELGVQSDVIKKDLGKVLLKLESLQDDNIKNTLEKQAQTAVELTESERREALDYLKSPSLLSRLLSDFDACGVVGEETNKLVGYLACVSRKLDKPLAIIIQSTSAAGKSSLMDAILNLMPEEERIQYSAMTGQSLFYMGEQNLKHKILAIAEEEGAEQASYALKLLQSEGQVSIASTGKNETTGTLETKSYTVEGPVMLFLTTTAIDIDEELMNRCVVLTVNETREQTQAIHALQRKSQTLEGLLQSETKKHTLQLHRNAQRLIKPLKVVNPYAEQLTFLSDKTRTRRDHMKYLQLINSITLLHQYQREIKTLKPLAASEDVIEYIEVTLSDIEQANHLAHEVLGRSLDELPPQTRKLLQLVYQMVMEACKKEQFEQQHYRFSRKQIRDATGWSDNQLKVHCHRLEELEYLLVHRGSRGNSIFYELLYSGSGVDQKQMMGLLNTSELKEHSYDDQKLGAAGERLGQKGNELVPSCPQVGVELGQGWSHENEKNTVNTDSNGFYPENSEKSTVKEKNKASNKSNGASHRNPIYDSPRSNTELAAMSAS